MRAAFTFVLATSLTACGPAKQAETAAAPTVQTIKVRSAEQDQLHQLDEMARNIGLKRAILTSGQRCDLVSESSYVTEHNNLSMWSANCAPRGRGEKRQWAIFVGPDGSAQVRPCDQMAQFKLPACKIGASEKERRGV